ncbi:hypothetical protein K505DRAFT_73130 [Melanomma pulvis-pyrius CBS 109.77]|uniref:Uncharacterized protein n=1 Tax=Melanomma pulvis-pyrius CBS 109.77 TaxID=1314802 RepID=A0A6A6X3Q6_9PLEO|nr:hypothetical protein K505DRAFT_73130 [Melanomma pulvis-pyrius CBS 109.77]
MLTHHLLLVFFPTTLLAYNLEITLWSTQDCVGDENALRPTLDLELHLGCNKRGDVADQLELELLSSSDTIPERRNEAALSAYSDGTMAAQSQTIVFFTSEDCDPATEIVDAYVDNSCSNVFHALDGDHWQSYEMRDACYGGLAGCDLDEEPADGPICERPLLPGWPGCGEPLNGNATE